jgi:hypothetical protein
MRRLSFLTVAACFVAQAALALLIIPPWQNPDEPQHLMSVHQVLAYGPDYRHDVLDPRAERAILASMMEHRWWEHYGLRAPASLPESFSDGPAQVISAYFGPPDGGSRLYYRFMAALFRAVGPDALLPQLYAMRAISVLLTVLALTCVWAAGRAALDPLSALNLAGAFVWFQALVLVQSQTVRVRDLCGLWGGAIAAFLLRRVGAPLLVVAAGVSAVASIRGRFGIGRPSPLRVVAGVTALVAAIALVSATADGARAVEWILRNPISVASIPASDFSNWAGFLGGLFRSFWLTAGWLRYAPPSWWLIVIIVTTTLAGIGLITGRRAAGDRRIVVLCVSMVATQLLAIIALYFVVLRTGAQGRYLFPVLPAALLLMWVGWRAWFEPKRDQMAAQVLVTAMALLNVTGWVTVIVPAYL